MTEPKYSLKDWQDITEKAKEIDNGIAYIMGRNAYLLDKPVGSCPYKDQSHIRNDWLLGWEDEENDITIEQRCNSCPSR